MPAGGSGPTCVFSVAPIQHPAWTLDVANAQPREASLSLQPHGSFREASLLLHHTLSTLVLSTNNTHHATHTWHGPLA
jgi:hypothetical protein